MREPFFLSRSNSPLIVSLPHVGTELPVALADSYVERAHALEDTDWHLRSLYDFASTLGATVIAAGVTRYVIDLNRPPDNAPMYPGAANTELCPTRFFTGEPLYRDMRAPGAAEIQLRMQRYWLPYHNALQTEIERLRHLHGYALLWDGHSIRSQIPWLFEGKLPDLNLGTAAGESCDPSLRAALADALQGEANFTHAIDARFKGGYITRHYGQPQHNVHAVQMEMCQSLYMNEAPPFAYREDLAARVQSTLKKLLGVMLRWKPV